MVLALGRPLSLSPWHHDTTNKKLEKFSLQVRVGRKADAQSQVAHLPERMQEAELISLAYSPDLSLAEQEKKIALGVFLTCTESGWFGLGGTFRGHLVHTPGSEEGHAQLEQVPQSLIQQNLESFQE